MQVLSLLTVTAFAALGATIPTKPDEAATGFITMTEPSSASTDVQSSEDDKAKCGGFCNWSSDCCPGDFCSVNWCNRGRKLADGTIELQNGITLAADYEDNVEDDIEDDVETAAHGSGTIETITEEDKANLINPMIVAEDDDYWYYAAIDTVDTLSGEKKKPKNKCPKKCGDGIHHCCKEHFCQLKKCRGEF
ncbi:hypothetical protein BJX99DRAFT_260050 [Aspergillus californicus]